MRTRHSKSNQENFFPNLTAMPDLPIIPYAKDQRPVILDPQCNHDDLHRAEVVIIT